MIWLDFETRSECDLKTAGVYNYARHPSTQILCMGFAFNDESVNVTTNVSEMRKVFANAPDQQICAHNAAFERLIIEHVLGMPMPIDRFYCTSAQARANCMPGSLEDVGRFMGASMRKDHKGGALVKKLCTPPFKGTDEDMKGLIRYCAQDVRAMRDFSQRIEPLSEEQLTDYHVNERINDRGVRVDVKLCRAALTYSEIEVVDIQKRVVDITKGAITSVRSPKMREWVLARLGPDARALAVKNDKPSIDKSVRAALLSMDDLDQVPPDVLEVIQCADDMWASSVAKFKRLEQLAGEDDRVRGAFVFAGGSATGRASSYGAQVHNFTRKCADKPDSVRQTLNHRQRQFAGFVDPCSCKLKRQQLAHVFGLVEGKKDDLGVQTGDAVARRQLQVVRDRGRPAHRTPDVLREDLGPRLDRGRPQLRVRVSHHDEAAVADVVDGAGRLLDRSQDHLRSARIGLPAADRAQQTSEERVVVQERPDGRALREVEVQSGEGFVIHVALAGSRAFGSHSSSSCFSAT